MNKAIGIDFGLKRTGISISDDLGIIATPLKTVASIDLMQEIENLVANEFIKTIVIGYPLDLSGKDTDITANVRLLKTAIEKQFSQCNVALYDERMTSKIAQQTLIQTVSKKKRQDKGRLDRLSATIILQDYLSANS